MKKKFARIFLLCFFLLGYLQAEIFEIEKLEEILPYVDDQTLVVLDIDDTLMVPAQMLGGDCWFRHQVKKLMGEGYSIKETLAQVLPEYMQLQHALEVKPVEKTTAAIVHRLQQTSHRLIGLTTRTEPVLYRTMKLLQSLGINLNKTALFHPSHSYTSDFSLHYFEGILSTGLRHKGEALMLLCQNFEYDPQKIIFVNDKLKYVQDVESSCKDLDIPYFGFRYAGADHHAQVYDPNVAQVQKKIFEQILTNEEAEFLLNLSMESHEN